MAGLLRRAAGQATLIGDHALVTALLAAALRLIGPGETGTLIAVGVIATEVTVPVPPFPPPPPPQAVRIKAHAIANAKKDGARALFSIWKSNCPGPYFLAPLNIMCSKKCESPVVPGCSLRDPIL